jgi:hypothetical protein
MSKTIKIHLDDAREVMYDELVKEFGEGMVKRQCDQHVADVITELYDNIDELKSQKQS